MKITIIKIFTILSIILILTPNICLASIPADIWGTITDGWDYWINKGDSTMMDIDIGIGKTSAIHENDDKIEVMLGIAQTVGSVVSVVALLIIGFRYMFSSVEEQAKVKGVLIYYVIGCVLVFATSNLLSVVYHVITRL